MSLQSGVPLRDGAKSVEGERSLPSENGAHGGRNRAIGDTFATRKTPEAKRRVGSLAYRNHRGSEAERFDRFVSPEPMSGCHLWAGSMQSAGYGFFTRANGKMVLAHRFAWEMERGPIPKGMQLDHRGCQNKACCNVRHLDLVTPGENTRRAYAKGLVRSRRGIFHPRRPHTVSVPSPTEAR